MAEKYFTLRLILKVYIKEGAKLTRQMQFLGGFLHKEREDFCYCFLSFISNFVDLILFSVLSVLFDVEFDCKMLVWSIYLRPTCFNMVINNPNNL